MPFISSPTFDDQQPATVMTKLSSSSATTTASSRQNTLNDISNGAETTSNLDVMSVRIGEPRRNMPSEVLSSNNNYQLAQQHQFIKSTPPPMSCESSINNNSNTNDNNGESIKFNYRIGYWWSDKKSQKLNVNELKNLFAERNCEFVKLDFDRPLDQQGQFDLIVHKVSDILVKADQGDLIAKKTISAFESYVRKHPQTILLDPLDNNRALLDRYKQYRLIEQSGLAKENVVFTPPFVHLTSTNIDVNRGRIRRSRLTFPIVCKPILAQGSTGAHQMCIIFNEAGLKDVKPPCVAQSFVNHNAKLFKLFVIKTKYYIIERPSLKNFQAGDYETVFFYSHDISKPNSSSSLTELDEEDKQNLENLIQKMKNLQSNEQQQQAIISDGSIAIDKHVLNNDKTTDERTKRITEGLNDDHDNQHCGGNNDDESRIEKSPRPRNTAFHSPLMPNDEKLSKIVKIFSEKLGLTFYGIDIIIENGTSRYAIIDMNTFPGYDGVENFLTIFRDVVCDAIPSESLDHQISQLQTKLIKKKHAEHDSGIEST